MKFDKIILVVFFLAFAFNSSKIYAQNAESPKLIKILNNYGRIPFEDGRTVVAEVKFIGLDNNEDYGEAIEPRVYKSDALKVLRENKAAINADDVFYGSKVSKTVKTLKETLEASGYVDAKVVAFGGELPKNRMNLIFKVERRELAYISEIRFEGNVNVADEELSENFKQCSGDDWKIFNSRKFEYYARICSRKFLHGRGFLKAQAEPTKPRIVAGQRIVTIQIVEGFRYRFGEIKIEGAKVFSEEKLLEAGELKTGEIADGETIQDFVYETLKNLYSDKGYILFNAEFDVDYIEPQTQGADAIVNVLIMIDEGKTFKIASIKFTGVDDEKARQLKENFSLKEGDVFNQSEFDKNLKKLDDTKEFRPIDSDKDVEISTNEQDAELFIIVKLLNANGN